MRRMGREPPVWRGSRFGVRLGYCGAYSFVMYKKELRTKCLVSNILLFRLIPYADEFIGDH